MAWTRLGDDVSIIKFVNACMTGQTFAKANNVALLRALALLPPNQVGMLLHRVVAANAVRVLPDCADLLELASHRVELRAPLLAATQSLIQALPGAPGLEADQTHTWRRRSPVHPNVVVDLMKAVVLIDADAAEHAARHLLNHPGIYDMDSCIVPSLRRLTAIRQAPGVRHLQEIALAHLRQRMAEDLSPPSDWSRSAPLACACQHCLSFNRFMADPQTRRWTLKAAELHRDHVQTQLIGLHCDVDISTDRGGRPYTLVSLKNQASFELRVRQRQQDVSDVATLTG